MVPKMQVKPACTFILEDIMTTAYLDTVLQVLFGWFLLGKFWGEFEAPPIHFIYQRMFVRKRQNLYSA